MANSNTQTSLAVIIVGYKSDGPVHSQGLRPRSICTCDHHNAVENARNGKQNVGPYMVMRCICNSAWPTASPVTDYGPTWTYNLWPAMKFFSMPLEIRPESDLHLELCSGQQMAILYTR